MDLPKERIGQGHSVDYCTHVAASLYTAYSGGFCSDHGKLHQDCYKIQASLNNCAHAQQNFTKM